MNHEENHGDLIQEIILGTKKAPLHIDWIDARGRNRRKVAPHRDSTV